MKFSIDIVHFLRIFIICFAFALPGLANAQFFEGATACSFQYEKRIQEVIWQEFNYQYQNSPGINATFKEICATGEARNVNEYSAAIMVMMVAMNSLGTDVADPEMKKEIDNFIRTHTNNVLRIMHRANQPESDIKELLLTILKTHNVDDEELYERIEGN
jgi:hypothetical protein